MAFDVERLGVLLREQKIDSAVTEIDEKRTHCIIEVRSERRPGYLGIVECEQWSGNRFAYLDVYPASIAEVARREGRAAGLSGQTYRLQLRGTESEDADAIARFVAQSFFNH